MADLKAAHEAISEFNKKRLDIKEEKDYYLQQISNLQS